MSSKTNSFMTKKKAFTLIELLIVIAIIGILFIVLVSKVDFATDKAKATGVQTDFRSFQLAFETVSKEKAGFNSFGWNTGDANANGVRDSVDEGDANEDGVYQSGETWTGHKKYLETWTEKYSLIKPGTTFEADGYDKDAIFALETAINKNLDPKLHITIDAKTGLITMANGAQDPWNTQYHGAYISAEDGMDRGAIVTYSNGANQKFGSEHSIANGVPTVIVPGNNKDGADDYSLVVCYTYTNGYGEVGHLTTGFSNNQTFLTGNGTGTTTPDVDSGMETGPVVNDSLVHNNIIPVGGTYYVGVTSNIEGNYDGATAIYEAGDEFPTLNAGDVYLYEDYEYRYGRFWDLLTDTWRTWKADWGPSGWGVKALDLTKTEYTKLLNTINNDNLVFMYSTYYKCENMLVAPTIPDSVIYLNGTFCHAFKLNTYVGSTDPVGDFSNYKIPSGVTDLTQTFLACYDLIKAPHVEHTSAVKAFGLYRACSKLTTVSALPDTIKEAGYIFYACNKLENFYGNTKLAGDFSDYYMPADTTNLNYSFYGCSSMVVAPNLTRCTNLTNVENAFACDKLRVGADLRNCTKLTSIYRMYVGCANLEDARYSSSTSVTNYSSAFSGKTNLVYAPVIYSAATNISNLFNGCTSLTGTVIIHANPSNYQNCFAGVDFATQNLTLSGDSTMLEQIGNTGTNYN